nr:DUF1214 domain-containing protein [Leifsonia naganoensis]
MDTRPGQVGFTLNSDTPYAPLFLDLTAEPLVVTLPPGPIVGAALDIDQGWIADLGIAGPDAGAGGRHIFVPFDHPAEGLDDVDGFVHRGRGRRVVVGLRGIPQNGDVEKAIALLRSVTVAPLRDDQGWVEPVWTDLTGKPQDTTPFAVQGTLDYWRVLQEYIDTEPVHDDDRAYLGELAVLGMRAGQPFDPDDRLRSILTAAAAEADAQLRVQSLADRRPDRVVWPDRQWEWVTLRPENADFRVEGRTDVDARETWFYQAIAASPAMFRRQAGAGSLYWFSARDADGRYLDGGRAYTLQVPLPVPAGLFWSVTVYDAVTRSQIATEQDGAALRSLFELTGLPVSGATTLHFGPEAPQDAGAAWIQTIPGRGWFVYVRLYGPTAEAFDGSWTLGDFVAG